jgi:hypothetical protein
MAKVYVKVLDLDPKSEAAQKLIHWKIPRPGAVCPPYGSINRILDVHVDPFREGRKRQVISLISVTRPSKLDRCRRSRRIYGPWTL